MKILAALFASTLTAFGGVQEDYTLALKKFRSLVADSDKLILSSGPLPFHEEKNVLTIDGRRGVAAVIAGIVFSERSLGDVFVGDDGKEVEMRVGCRCLGHGELLFFSRGVLRARVANFHWKEFHVSGDPDAFVLDVLGHGEELKSIWRLLIDGRDSEEAIQSAQTTSGS